MKKLVVVVPTYNEVDNIENMVKKILKQETKMAGWKIEVLISDSRSYDGTTEIGQRLALKNSKIHLIIVGKGLGTGLIKGHLYSLKHLRPHVLAQIDADGQVKPDVLPKLVETIEQGYDLVLGSRFIKGGKNKISLFDRILSKGSSWFCKLVMGPININEFTTMTRAFTPQLFKRINLRRLPWREETFIIQPAFLHEAILAGAKYREIPVVCKERLKNYSKNKIVNYTYDVITYALDARLKKWGLSIPLFNFSRKFKGIINI